jgi:hypothetical protein
MRPDVNGTVFCISVQADKLFDALLLCVALATSQGSERT